jgi:hypothetical protein
MDITHPVLVECGVLIARILMTVEHTLNTELGIVGDRRTRDIDFGLLTHVIILEFPIGHDSP